MIDRSDESHNNVYVRWQIESSGKDDIEMYLEQRESNALVESEELRLLDNIISAHVRYLHYNCAK